MTASADFLTWLGVSESGRAILDRAAREFEETGSWVTLDTLAYEAAADSDSPGLEINEIFRLPTVLGGFWSSEEFHPTGLGLIEATTAPQTAEHLARVARICADRKFEFRDQAKIGEEILVSEYGFDPTWAKRCEHLVQSIPGLTAGGTFGANWRRDIYRGALDYRTINTVDDLRVHLEDEAKKRLRAHQQALAVAPAFAPGGIFDPETSLAPQETTETSVADAQAVFVIHGRDVEAKDAIWNYLTDLGLHPLDWEELVVATGSGAPYIGDVLVAAFRNAQAVLVLLTPDDCVMLHPDLHELGEESYELELTGQARPNVLFEAGMAFGFNPTRTILVEIGATRAVSDLGGRHRIRIGTQSTLRDLAGRLEAAGCLVDREAGDWMNVERFANLSAKARSAQRSRSKLRDVPYSGEPTCQIRSVVAISANDYSYDRSSNCDGRFGMRDDLLRRPNSRDCRGDAVGSSPFDCAETRRQHRLDVLWPGSGARRTSQRRPWSGSRCKCAH